MGERGRDGKTNGERETEETEKEKGLGDGEGYENCSQAALITKLLKQ